MNPELFNFLKIKPFAELTHMSHARFTQKLHNYLVKGRLQQFSPNDKRRMKQGLLVIAELIKQEAEKINIEEQLTQPPVRPTRKLCKERTK